MVLLPPTAHFEHGCFLSAVASSTLRGVCAVARALEHVDDIPHEGLCTCVEVTCHIQLASLWGAAWSTPQCHKTEVYFLTVLTLLEGRLVL